MNYQETQYVRDLKHRKPPASSMLVLNTADETNADEQEVLQDIKEKVTSIVDRIESLLEKREENLPFEEFLQSYVALKQEFVEINFMENDERIEVASEILFKKAFDLKQFGFDSYTRLIVGLRKQSLVTVKKFFEKLFDLCDKAVYSFKFEFTEKSDPGREALCLGSMIDELFGDQILSTKSVVDYIHLLMDSTIRSPLLVKTIYTFLSSHGPRLDSDINEAEVYRKGMTMLGKKLDWFEDFKTLDSVYAELKRLSSDPEIEESFGSKLKELCTKRENNWKRNSAKNGTENDKTVGEKQRSMLEPIFGSDDESSTSNSESDEESSASDPEEPGTNEVTRPESELSKYFQKLAIGNPLSSEQREYLKNNLFSRHHYFQFWLGDYAITDQKLEAITDELYQFVASPKNTNFEDSFNTVEMTTLQKATAPLVEAFFNLKLGNLKLTKSNVMWVEKLVDHFLKTNIVSDDYCSGLTYLCTLLKVEWSLQEESTTDQAIIYLENVNFNILKPKGKSIVWIARWMFDQSIHERKRDATDHLLKARDLDPDNWVWNYVLCNRLRFQRRQSFAVQSVPDKVEFEAIVNAVQLNPPGSEYRAMCISGLCQSLAEILRFRTIRRITDEPVDIRTRVLKSNTEIKDYIFEEAGNSLEGQTISFAEYIRYGEILSSILPQEYRNYDLAELCYMNCIGIMPTNSKALHRMGLLQLVGKQDAVKALQYFKRAVSSAPANYPARMDLLQTLLGRVLDNEKRVGDAFTEALELNSWNLTERSNLYFLYGCYYWIIKNKTSALEMWMKIRYEHADQLNLFQRLHSMQKRHHWPKDACFSVDEIWEEIQVYSKTGPLKASIQTLRTMVEEIVRNNTSRNPRFQQHGYPNSNTGYSPRTRTSSGSGDYEYGAARRGSDSGPGLRSKPVSVADQDSSWRTSDKNIPITSSDSQPRNDQQRLDSYGTGRSPGNYQYGNSPRNNYNNRSWDNGNRVTQGNDRRNRSPSPDSWR